MAAGRIRDGSKYPWAAWLARDQFTLTRGTDYHTSTLGMCQQVRNRAVAHGLRVAIRDLGDRLHVVVTRRPEATR